MPRIEAIFQPDAEELQRLVQMRPRIGVLTDSTDGNLAKVDTIPLVPGLVGC